MVNELEQERDMIVGLDYYIEANTGAIVFTEGFLLKRGKCCGSGCRHCPYANQRRLDDEEGSKKEQSSNE